MKSLLLYIEHIFVFFNRCIEKLSGSTKPASILTYQSYSNATRTRILGRVVERISHTEFSKDQKHFRHFVKTVKLFLTKKISHATVEVQIGERPYIFHSNEEGFFSEVISVNSKDKVDVKLLSTHLKDIEIKKSNFQIPVNVPSKTIDRIFISDIDDTIIQSKAVSMVSLVVKTLFKPIGKRVAFQEAAATYNKFKKNAESGKQNLFFYVSSSTWNLYPLLRGFLKENSFPNGPLLLQDIATEKKKSHSNSHQHKFDRIEEIIDFYPEAKYVLIGDAGQRDASIYLDIAEKYREKVEVILIRNTWWTKEILEPTEHIERAKSIGVPLVYFDSLESLPSETIRILERQRP